jgi:hypothetical protein
MWMSGSSSKFESHVLMPKFEIEKEEQNASPARLKKKSETPASCIRDSFQGLLQHHEKSPRKLKLTETDSAKALQILPFLQHSSDL